MALYTGEPSRLFSFEEYVLFAYTTYNEMEYALNHVQACSSSDHRRVQCQREKQKLLITFQEILLEQNRTFYTEIPPSQCFRMHCSKKANPLSSSRQKRLEDNLLKKVLTNSPLFSALSQAKPTADPEPADSLKSMIFQEQKFRDFLNQAIKRVEQKRTPHSQESAFPSPSSQIKRYPVALAILGLALIPPYMYSFFNSTSSPF